MSKAKFHPVPETASAAWITDVNGRLSSSSGGFFRVLVRYVLERGGTVFGAAFDEHFALRHRSARTPEECEGFYGSKYLKSDIGDTYREVRELLDAGSWVLYSGTPCQISGLYASIGGDSERLVTCGLVCGGAPSPEVFRAFLKWLEARQGAAVRDISFRDKRKGWKRPVFYAAFENGREYVKPLYETPFGRGFGMGLTLSAVCGVCPYARPERTADFTLGDFWGLKAPFPPEAEKGVSLVLFNSPKAKELVLPPVFEQEQRPFAEAAAGNPRLTCPVKLHKDRDAFFRDVETMPFEQVIKKWLSPPPLPYRIAAKVLPEKVKAFLSRAAGRSR